MVPGASQYPWFCILTDLGITSQRYTVISVRKAWSSGRLPTTPLRSDRFPSVRVDLTSQICVPKVVTPTRLSCPFGNLRDKGEERKMKPAWLTHAS